MNLPILANPVRRKKLCRNINMAAISPSSEDFDESDNDNDSEDDAEGADDAGDDYEGGDDGGDGGDDGDAE